ncbi:MAG TPA: DUF3054 domain-containing protein [Acidimicrobiales bacterium]|jgi:hypothetical protein|nr:DUF3054 domain-containing protein [Acidimicrobiales bacterium]
MGKVAVALDTVIVLVFVAIGRTAHAHGVTTAGLASTAWPFLAALALGWLAVAMGRRDGTAWSGGLVVWISTVVLGMVFRVVSGQGTAVAFVFVALGFLGVTMLGWRALVVGIRHWRSAGATPDGRTGGQIIRR